MHNYTETRYRFMEDGVVYLSSLVHTHYAPADKAFATSHDNEYIEPSKVIEVQRYNDTLFHLKHENFPALSTCGLICCRECVTPAVVHHSGPPDKIATNITCLDHTGKCYGPCTPAHT